MLAKKNAVVAWKMNEFSEGDLANLSEFLIHSSSIQFNLYSLTFFQWMSDGPQRVVPMWCPSVAVSPLIGRRLGTAFFLSHARFCFFFLFLQRLIRFFVRRNSFSCRRISIFYRQQLRKKWLECRQKVEFKQSYDVRCCNIDSCCIS